MGEDDKMPPTDPYFSRLSDELPQHKVTISQPFSLGSTEVTTVSSASSSRRPNTSLRRRSMASATGPKVIEKAKHHRKGDNWKSPGYPITDDTPVTQITWNDACAYRAWLGDKYSVGLGIVPMATMTGSSRRVQTATGCRPKRNGNVPARAGTMTQYSFGDDKSQLEHYDWFKKNSRGNAMPVALKLPNPFGLFDMHGNVYELCQDWYEGKWYETSLPGEPNGPSSGSDRAIRAAAGAPTPRSAVPRVATSTRPSYRFNNRGFRCVTAPFLEFGYRCSDGHADCFTNQAHEALETAYNSRCGSKPRKRCRPKSRSKPSARSWWS